MDPSVINVPVTGLLVIVLLLCLAVTRGATWYRTGGLCAAILAVLWMVLPSIGGPQ